MPRPALVSPHETTRPDTSNRDERRPDADPALARRSFPNASIPDSRTHPRLFPKVDCKYLLWGFFYKDCLGVAANKLENRSFAITPHSADQRNVHVIWLSSIGQRTSDPKAHRHSVVEH